MLDWKFEKCKQGEGMSPSASEYVFGFRKGGDWFEFMASRDGCMAGHMDGYFSGMTGEPSQIKILQFVAEDHENIEDISGSPELEIVGVTAGDDPNGEGDCVTEPDMTDMLPAVANDHAIDTNEVDAAANERPIDDDAGRDGPTELPTDPNERGDGAAKHENEDVDTDKTSKASDVIRVTKLLVVGVCAWILFATL